MSNPPKTALEHFNTGAAKYEASTGGCTRELARYVVEICPPFDSGSTILDNACGTGIVAQEVLRTVLKSTNPPPTIACVDGAPAMIDLARSAAPADNSSTTLSFETMPGENLAFPDEYFTHSITNLGILFFSDPIKGAKEIFRTLKPGGTAVVTSWATLGYVELIHQVQKAIRPNDPLFQVPVSAEWYQEAHLEKTLREGGFEDVKVHKKKVHYAAKTVAEVRDFLVVLLAPLLQSWNEEENINFRKQLESAVEKTAVKIERLVPGGSPGEVEALVGIPMIALVAVARK